MAETSKMKRGALIIGAIVVVVAVVVMLGVTIFGDSDSDTDSGSGPKPGTIVSSTPISGAPAGSTGWRIVYNTRTAEGKAAVSSGTVYVPTTPAPAGGRPVVAWAHPTLGTGQSCTPSQAADPTTAIPGFAQMMANGWAVASTDYTGLGTDGVLPYLIGVGEARNVIDSVRAARELPGTDAGTTYAVWGHSQGGHASLFTGDEASSYAPELRLVGVAGAAPAAELSSLVSLQWQNSVSWVIGSEVIELWPEFYPGLSASAIATPLAMQNAAALGAVCITSNIDALVASYGSVLTQPFFSVDPVTVPDWRAQFDANTPSADRRVPVLVAQGLEDTVVLPATTAQLQQDWCAAGASVTVQWYPTADHFTVPSLAAPSAMTWIQQLFAGQSPGNTCGQTPPVAPATEPPPAD